MSGPLKSDTNRPRKKTKEITRNSNHTCTSLTYILKKHISLLPYFSSFVLSGAPRVIDTNWERVSSMVTVWMHRPWLSSYEIVHCPWKQILYFTKEKTSSEVYTCCKISGNLENLPHENVWIFTISWISGAFFSSNLQVKSWLVPQTEELMSQESKKRKEKFIFAISVQLFQFSFHFIVCNKYPACKDA